MHLIVYQNQVFKTYIYQAQLLLACPPLAFLIKPLPWLSNDKADVFTKRRDQLHLTGFSTLLSTIVLKNS